MVGTTRECFLCLNNIETTNEDDSSNGKHGVTIKCEDGVRADDDRDNNGKFSLRYICRYLNINWKDDDDDQRGLEDHNMDRFSVKLCMKCNQIVSRLSGLCEELEMLRMNVNHSLQELNEALKSNPRDDSSGNGTNGMETMRAELKRKCDQNLKCVFPRVRIAKDSKETGNLLMMPKNSGPNWSDVVTTVNVLTPDDMVLGSSDTTGVDAVVVSVPSSVETSSSFSSALKSGRKLNGKKLKKRDCEVVKCTICRPHREMPDDASTILTHKMGYHLETLFAPCKDPNMSLDNFKVYCRHMLKIEVLSIEPQYNPKTGTPLCQCSFCLLKLSSEETLEAHLVTRHKKILDRKLVHLQKSFTVDKIIHEESSKLDKARSDRWKCVDCGEKFRHSKSVRKHRNKSCPVGPSKNKKRFESSSAVQKQKIKCQKGTSVTESKMTGVKSTSKKKRVTESKVNSQSAGASGSASVGGSGGGGNASGGKSVSRSSKSGKRSTVCTFCHPHRKMSVDTFRHHKNSHLEIIFASCKEPAMSETDFKEYCQHVIKLEVLSSQQQYRETDGDPFCQCPHCSESLSCHYSLELHMIRKHEEVLEKKIMELIRSSSIEEIRSFDIQTLEESRRWKCFDCGELFKQVRCLRQHKKQFCPFGQRLNCADLKGYRCSVCKKRFRTRNDLLSHKKIYCRQDIIVSGSNSIREKSGNTQSLLRDSMTTSIDEVSEDSKPDDNNMSTVVVGANREMEESFDEFSSSNVTVKTEEGHFANDYWENKCESMEVKVEDLDPDLFL